MSIQIVKAPSVVGVDIVSIVGSEFEKEIRKYMGDDCLYTFQVKRNNDGSLPFIVFDDGEHAYKLVCGLLYTDFASIPVVPIIYEMFKLLQPIPPIFHDQAFVVNTDGDNSIGEWYVDDVKQSGRMPFSLCNSMYKSLLLHYGVSKAKATAEYLAIEIGGKSTYNAHTEVTHD